MKDISEYLHLYIGQEVETPTRKYKPEGGKSYKAVGRIMDIDMVINQVGIHFHENALTDLDNYPFSEIKLIVRRLSDIKREDVDLGDFIPEFEVRVERTNRDYCIILDSIHDDGYALTIYPDGSMYCICKDNGENYPYRGGELFLQLLSKGFWLFDQSYFDKGLILDKAKL